MFDWVVHYALGNIPMWVWPALGGSGLTVYLLSGVLSYVPAVKPYAMFIKPVAGLACLFGVFMYGGSGVIEVYQADIKEAEHQAELAAEKSRSANEKLDMALKANAGLIKDRAATNRSTIESHRETINKECTLSTIAVEDYNRAVKNSQGVKK